MDLMETVQPFRNLTVGYKTSLIQNINLALPSRGLVLISGSNGSGKTAFFNTLKGLIKPLGGSFDKAFLSSLYLLQCSLLYEKLSVSKNFDLILQEELAREEKENILNSYSIFGKLDQRVSTLSYGEKTRTIAAIVAQSKAEIILMDEQDKGLDEESLLILYQNVQKIGSQKLVLFVSHNEGFAEKFADFVYEIKNRELILIRSKTETIVEAPPTPTGSSPLGHRQEFLAVTSSIKYTLLDIFSLFSCLIMLLASIVLNTFNTPIKDGFAEIAADYVEVFSPSSAISRRMLDNLSKTTGLEMHYNYFTGNNSFYPFVVKDKQDELYLNGRLLPWTSGLKISKGRDIELGHPEILLNSYALAFLEENVEIPDFKELEVFLKIDLNISYTDANFANPCSSRSTSDHRFRITGIVDEDTNLAIPKIYYDADLIEKTFLSVSFGDLTFGEIIEDNSKIISNPQLKIMSNGTPEFTKKHYGRDLEINDMRWLSNFPIQEAIQENLYFHYSAKDINDGFQIAASAVLIVIYLFQITWHLKKNRSVFAANLLYGHRRSLVLNCFLYLTLVPAILLIAYFCTASIYYLSVSIFLFAMGMICLLFTGRKKSICSLSRSES